MDVTESESIVIEPISPGLLISFTFNLMPLKIHKMKSFLTQLENFSTYDDD